MQVKKQEAGEKDGDLDENELTPEQWGVAASALPSCQTKLPDSIPLWGHASRVQRNGH